MGPAALAALKTLGPTVLSGLMSGGGQQVAAPAPAFQPGAAQPLTAPPVNAPTNPIGDAIAQLPASSGGLLGGLNPDYTTGSNGGTWQDPFEEPAAPKGRTFEDFLGG